MLLCGCEKPYDNPVDPDAIYDCLGTFEGDALEDNCGTCDSDSSNDCSLDCNNVWGGNATLDACGVCGGDGSSCDNGDLWSVFYDVSEEIGGFQFTVNGGNVINAKGGAAEEAGFSLSNSTSTVLGFSFSGSSIPAGSGILVGLEISGEQSTFCLENLVLSGVSGEEINATIENCKTIKY